MDGELLIDKPSGMTSYDVIRLLQPLFRDEKLGHAGTLDPRATGLLIVGVGKATKSLPVFLKLGKCYRAEIILGVATSTGDMDGETVGEADVPMTADSRVPSALLSLVGENELAVPMVSAVKVGGVPLYEHVRRGNPGNLSAPRRIMRVVGARFIDTKRSDGRLVVSAEFDVESGVYIRSLGIELGRRLGVPSALTALRRTSIGPFSVDEAVVPAAVSKASLYETESLLARIEIWRKASLKAEP